MGEQRSEHEGGSDLGSGGEPGHGPLPSSGVRSPKELQAGGSPMASSAPHGLRAPPPDDSPCGASSGSGSRPGLLPSAREPRERVRLAVCSLPLAGTVVGSSALRWATFRPTSAGSTCRGDGASAGGGAEWRPRPRSSALELSGCAPGGAPLSARSRSATFFEVEPPVVALPCGTSFDSEHDLPSRSSHRERRNPHTGRSFPFILPLTWGGSGRSRHLAVTSPRSAGVVFRPGLADEPSLPVDTLRASGLFRAPSQVGLAL